MLTVQQFCELQGLDKFTSYAVCKYGKQHGTEHTYDEWYDLLVDHFEIGDKIEIGTPTPAVEPNNPGTNNEENTGSTEGAAGAEAVKRTRKANIQ